MPFKMQVFRSALLCVIACLLSTADGLELDGIELMGGHRFAQLNSRATLVCQHSLSPGEEIQKITWMKDGESVYTWTPGGSDVPAAYSEAIDISAEDGSLTYRTVTLEYGGTYSCTVMTTDLQQKTSEGFGIAVADVPSDGFSMRGNVANCTLHFSFTSPPIYPKPTPLCGVWSTDTGYTGTATDWQAVPYYNGSVAYSIEDTTFAVRSMPLQAGIRCEMSFMAPSGRVTDDAKVIAWQNTAYYPQVSERGCPVLEVGDGLMVQYKNHRVSCRGEMVPQDDSQELLATVSCDTGLYSTLRGGSVSSVELRCSGSPVWEPLSPVSWHEFEEMSCTATAPSKTFMKNRDHQKEDKQNKDQAMKEDPATAATTDAGAIPSSTGVMVALVAVFSLVSHTIMI